MKIKGNTFYFAFREKRIIKSMVDNVYGKETTPADYDTTGGDYDMGIEGDIKGKTGENVSGSTIERLVGLREKEVKGVSRSTLSIVAKYLGFNGHERLLDYIEYSSVHRSEKEPGFNVEDLVRQHAIRLSFNENKVLILNYHNESSFEVISSENTKLKACDKLEVKHIDAGEEFICTRVLRQHNNRWISLGTYKSGSDNPVSCIELLKTEL